VGSVVEIAVRAIPASYATDIRDSQIFPHIMAYVGTATRTLCSQTVATIAMSVFFMTDRC
jgi:hypothetical protein